MTKDQNDTESVQDPYAGPLLFINKTPDTLKKNPQESFTISSHVSKAHRRWQKEEKLKKLKASSSKTTIPRTILPSKSQILPAGSSKLAPLASYVPARATAGSDPLQGTGTGSGSEAHSGTDGRLPRTEYSPSVYPFEGSQERDDQQRESHKNRRIRANNRPALNPFRGNSDPFSAAALPLAAHDHEIIRHAQRFFVFVAWPDKKSAVWRAPISDSSSSHIRLRQTITDEAEVHAILAAGYSVVAELSSHDPERSHARGLYHKTKAVELLRDRLVKHGFSQSVTTLIRLLISLDFHTSENEAALVHLRGLWSMAATTPGILVDAQELLRVSDAWISISLLKRPEISPSRYDPGERRLQPFAETLDALSVEHGVRTLDPDNEDTHDFSAFDNRTWTIISGAREIVDTKTIMDKIEDSDLLQDIIQWMNKRSSALTGYCTTGYVDNTEAAGSNEARRAEINQREHFISKTLAAAACLCAMMFMNFKFLNLATNYNFSKTCQKIESLLHVVAKHILRHEFALPKGVLSDYLWLLFLTAMGTDIFSARGDIPYSSWLSTQFHWICKLLELDEENDITCTLRRYPHYAEMNAFRAELLASRDRDIGGGDDDEERRPKKSLISWVEWRDILNHA